MNKLTPVFALGLAFALVATAPIQSRADIMSPGGVGSPASPVDPLYKAASFGNTRISATDFGKYFDAKNPVTSLMSTPFNFVGTPIEGSVSSQVFKGTGAADGLYAYAYQVTSKGLGANAPKLTNFDGVAFRFNASPVTTNFAGADTRSYLVNGAIGNLAAPTLLADGKFAAPASVYHQAISDANGDLIAGSLTAEFTPRLQPGQTSATFVVLTTEKPDGPVGVNLRSLDPTQSITTVWQTAAGTLIPNPVPEPGTVIAWLGMIGAAAVVRRHRNRRAG